MSFKFAMDRFCRTKRCSRPVSSKVKLFMQIGRFAFCRRPLGDVRATYVDHLRLSGM